MLSLTQEQANWLADQIELGQYRTLASVPPDVDAVLADLRGGGYTNA